MSELTPVNPWLRRLLFHSGWRTLAERSALLLLLGGGLSLVTAALFAVEALSILSIQGLLTGVTGSAGIILSYAGLLGLYPWYAERTPRLARAGFVLVALPTLVITVLLVWGLASHLPFGTVPSPIDVLPGHGLIFVLTFLLLAVGVGTFGVASLRTGIPSRPTGILLVGLAATWGVLLGASGVYGSKFPAWLDALSFGMMATFLSGIGYALRRKSPPRDRTGEAAESTR